MIDLQTIVSTLMNLLLYGGADAAKELFKDVVVGNAAEASNLWRELMVKEPRLYPLADQVAAAPDDAARRAELSALLESVLQAHPELLPTGDLRVTTGDIRADHGVAAAVVNGHITIINR